MITDNNKKLAQWALDFALKNGCQAAKLVLYANSNTSFDLRNAQMDKLQQASESGLTINLYVDGRYGSYSTNRLDKKELETFIRNGIESAPEEVMGKDERIISVDTSFSDGESASYRLTSNGFEGEERSTWFSVSASVSIKGEGEARPSDMWYDSALFYDKLQKTGIGQKALERVLRKLGQRKTASGKYTLIVDSLNSSRLLSPLLSALYGSSLQQHNSFLLDKLNTKVGADCLTLTDEPHLIGANGAGYFDAEGVATERRPIFDQGILKTYFIDTYNSKKMGVPPTISSPSILVMAPGEKSLDELLAGVGKGILVTGFNGGNCNSTTGDFSYGIEGFLVEDGRMVQPVNEMNVTGNMLTLWQSLAAVGNDPRLSSSWRIPSLLFEGVDFSGL